MTPKLTSDSVVDLPLLEGLMQAASGPADDAPDQIVRTLRDAFELKACSFYSLNYRAHTLTLRAQAGFNYDEYRSLVLPLTSTAGRAITEGKLVYVDDLRQANDFRDRALIETHRLVSGLFLPLTTPADPSAASGITDQSDNLARFCAVICLYPIDRPSAVSMKSWLNSFERIIGQTYGHSVSFDRLRARDDILNACMPNRDFNGMLHRLVRRLHDVWHFEAASIFLHDSRADLLRLTATTGITGKPRRADVVYSMHETQRRTVEAFQQVKILNLHDQRSLLAGKYSEVVAGLRTGLLLIPIFEPAERRAADRRCLGVLRLVNRVLIRGSHREVTSFGWEDEAFGCFIAEIIGVLYFLFSTAAAKAEDFDRAIHGLQTQVLATLSRLNQLMEQPPIHASLRETRFAYHIPDAVSHLDAAIWQLKLAAHELTDKELSIRPLKLLGEVMASMVAQLPKYAKVLNTPPPRLPCYDQEAFQQSPVILADPEALANILRCLFENALKYTKAGASHCELTIYWKSSQNAIELYVCDQGIGVDRKDRPFLFREGFRTEDARRRHPAGQGIGLATARQLAQLMNGSLELCPADTRHSTVFRLKLPTVEKSQ